MKRWLMPLALALGLAAGATPAVAAPPDRYPANTAFDLQCPGYLIHAVVSGKYKTIDVPGGRQIVTSPGVKATLTGPGGTVSYVLTGVSRYQTLPDGGQEVKATGRNLVYVPKTKQHPQGQFLTIGNVNWALNADGSERRLFSGSGRVIDVCALLAK
jgi:hypothetical protein